MIGKSSGAIRSAYRHALVTLCLCLVLAGSILGFRTSLGAGPIWDDAHELLMMNMLLAIEKRPDLSYEAARTRMEGVAFAGGYYGAVPQFAAHALQAIANSQPWSTREDLSPDNIAWRHLVGFGFTILAAASLFLTAATISGRPLLGLMMMAVLMSAPVFLGLSSIDDKDAPIAAGLTLFSSGASLLLWRLFRDDALPPPLELISSSRAAYVLAAAMIFLGTLMAFGTRAGAAILIGVECAVVGVLFGLAIRRVGLARAAWATTVLLAAASFGAVLATALNPLARKAPIRWVIESVFYAGNAPSQPVKLYGQIIMSNKLPWWYVPGWVVAEYPIAFLALAFLGGLGLIRLLWREPQLSRVYPWVPFVVQGFVLPLCIVLSGSVLHDRLRHLLFIIPPLAMLAGVGLYLCVDGVRNGATYASAALAIAGPALLLTMFVNTLIWYPYQYAYLNEIARSFPQFAFDNEPLGLTLNEAIVRMRHLGMRNLKAGPTFGFLNYHEDEWGIFVDHVIDRSSASPLHPTPGSGAYYIHARPSWNATGLPSYCRTLFQIQRQGVVLGVGGEC